MSLPVQLTDAELCRIRQEAGRRQIPLFAGSVGQLNGPSTALGEGVPCWNSRASRLLRCLGGTAQVLPRELSKSEIDVLLAAAPEASFILPVYGRARLMYLNHCPARTAMGLQGDRRGCELCAKGLGCAGQALTDRRGESFPLLPVRTENGCLVQLLSCQTRSLCGLAQKNISWLLDFTIESPEEAAAITRAYRTIMDGGKAEIPGSLERFDAGVE